MRGGARLSAFSRMLPFRRLGAAVEVWACGDQQLAGSACSHVFIRLMAAGDGRLLRAASRAPTLTRGRGAGRDGAGREAGSQGTRRRQRRQARPAGAPGAHHAARPGAAAGHLHQLHRHGCAPLRYRPACPSDARSAGRAEEAPLGPALATKMTRGTLCARTEQSPLGTSSAWQAPACWHHARPSDAFIALRGTQAVQGAGAPAQRVCAPLALHQPQLCTRRSARRARAPGNLLAPVAGSAVAGAARSGWKRLRIARRGAARLREQERLSAERGARVSWKEVRP